MESNFMPPFARPAPHARRRGYTAIEFILVIAITGILVVGLSAIVDMPAEVVRRQDEGSGLSTLDQALSVFDKDVRFAIDATAPDARTLDLVVHGGGTVRWSWNGTSGSPLQRTDGSGTVAVVPSVRSAQFDVQLTQHRVTSTSSVPTVTTPTVGASFTQYTVKPGYQLLGLGDSVIRGLLGVTEIVGTRTINSANSVGLFFKVPAGAQDGSYPSSITVRLSRAGTADLLVRCFEADAVTRTPDRANAVGMAYVRSADIPSTMAEVTIRLSPLKRVRGTGSYFVDFSGTAAGASANFEFRKLSIDLAATDWGGGLLYSTNAGASFAPISSVLANSQTKFSFSLTKEKDANTADVNDTITSTTASIPTGVALTLAVAGEGGATRELRVSVPIENNVQLVNQ